MGDLRWSMEALGVLSLFRTGQRLHGYAVCEEAGLQYRTGYRILDRFAEAGILNRQMEAVNPTLSERTPRIMYQLTEIGSARIAEIRALVST